MNATTYTPTPKMETVSNFTAGLVIIIEPHQAKPYAGLREVMIDISDGKRLLVTSPPEPRTTD